jgi:hypothetical protein
MYKDKDKQREANRQAQAKHKAKLKGITEQGITEPKVIPEQQAEVIPSKPPEVLASRERSFEGSARPGDADYPEQTGLNTCSKCGAKLKYDVMDVCLPCTIPSDAPG